MTETIEKGKGYDVANMVELVDELFASGKAEVGSPEERRAEVRGMVQRAQALQQRAHAKRDDLLPGLK
jgi:hypothetical protein